MRKLAELDVNPKSPTYNLCTICGKESDFTEGKAIRWRVRNGGVCDGCVTEYRDRNKKKDFTSDYLKKKAKQILEKDEVTVKDILKVRALLRGESNK